MVENHANPYILKLTTSKIIYWLYVLYGLNQAIADNKYAIILTSICRLWRRSSTHSVRSKMIHIILHQFQHFTDIFSDILRLTEAYTLNLSQWHWRQQFVTAAHGYNLAPQKSFMPRVFHPSQGGEASYNYTKLRNTRFLVNQSIYSTEISGVPRGGNGGVRTPPLFKKMVLEISPKMQ